MLIQLEKHDLLKKTLAQKPKQTKTKGRREYVLEVLKQQHVFLVVFNVKETDAVTFTYASDSVFR